MKVQSLDIGYAMQLAVLDQKLLFEVENESDKSLVQLDIRMKSWLSDEYQAVGVLDSGLVVGFCLFKILDDAISIEKIYVIEDERRKGIATALIAEIKSKELTKRIRLNVASKHNAGKKFFKKVGLHYSSFGVQVLS